MALIYTAKEMSYIAEVEYSTYVESHNKGLFYNDFPAIVEIVMHMGVVDTIHLH